MAAERRTILVSGGGTGGHVFPAVAVAHAIVAADPRYEPVFIGTEDRLEGRLVPEAGFTLHHIEAVPVPRRPSLRILRLPFALRRAVRRCMDLAVETEAVAVATFGGFVSFPVARAAHRLGLPLVVHEQNSVPGLANRFAARWADRIAVSFPGSADRFAHPERVAVTGNPVREAIRGAGTEERHAASLAHFKLRPGRRTLLVLGGSQGAQTLNRALIASHARWRNHAELQILHAAGRNHYRESAAAWERARNTSEGPLVRCIDFIDDMGAAYDVADVVLSRAGATTIAELTVLGKPSVLVPYPHATGDHQRHNAVALEAAGAARMIADDALDSDRLVAAVEPLLEDGEAREAMASAARVFGRPNAADNVTRVLLGLVEGSGGVRGT
ncbi:MAG: undecaprenyldiphospho-muramoylpentapeptide beta-N-acetylglucosaminyltransferase [Nitriliruptorales bacterium]